MQSHPLNLKTLQKAVKILKKGGVIAHPADTCFGLAADPKSLKAIETIQLIKGRDDLKPMSLMLGTSAKKTIEDYGTLDDFSRHCVDKLLPGPVTLLLPKGPEIPAHYFPETDLIGLRIPDDALMQMLVTQFGGPLITTSANKAGQLLCYTAEEVMRSVNAFPDLIFEGEVRKGPASTVIRPDNGAIEIVREGALGKQELQAMLKKN